MKNYIGGQIEVRQKTPCLLNAKIIIGRWAKDALYLERKIIIENNERGS